MAPETSEQHDRIKAAGLYCQGMSIHDISTIMSGLDEERVREMLETALHDGIFRYDPVLTVKNMDEENREFLYNHTLINALSDALSDTLNIRGIPIHITHSPPEMFQHYTLDPLEDKDEYLKYLAAETQSLKTLGRSAARIVSAALADGEKHVVGVNYGASVMFTVDAVAPPAGRVPDEVTVVSLFGDLRFHPTQTENEMINKERAIVCNELVIQLANRIGPRAKAELLNIPVFIPHAFTADDKSFHNIRHFLTSHESYVPIFGRMNGDAEARSTDAPLSGETRHTDSLISKMDTLITGFGSVDNYTVLQMFLSTWLTAEEFKTLISYAKEGRIVGDLGGHFITRPNDVDSDGELGKFLQSINKRLIATRPSDFTAVARFHAEKPHTGAGVVGIAAGARKAKILHALLSQTKRPISRLFIDSHCALALLNLLGAERLDNLVQAHGAAILGRIDKWSKGSRSLIPIRA